MKTSGNGGGVPGEPMSNVRVENARFGNRLPVFSSRVTRLWRSCRAWTASICFCFANETTSHTYFANQLNQYTLILCASAPLREISHDPDGNLVSDTKDLSGTLHGAGGVGGLLFLDIDGRMLFPHFDANGNVLRYVDAAGLPVAEFAYDAFGALVSATGPESSTVPPFRFSTKYFDPETGLYYYGRRFYSPALRRWLSRDPIEEDGGLNLYAFCQNDPLGNVDATGESACSCFSVDLRLVYTFTWDGVLAKKHEYPEGIVNGGTYPSEKQRSGKSWPHVEMFSPAEYIKVSAKEQSGDCCLGIGLRIEIEELGARSPKRDTPFRVQANQDGQWGKTNTVTLNVVRRPHGTVSLYRILVEAVGTDSSSGVDICRDTRFSIIH